MTQMLILETVVLNLECLLHWLLQTAEVLWVDK